MNRSDELRKTQIAPFKLEDVRFKWVARHDLWMCHSTHTRSGQTTSRCICRPMCEWECRMRWCCTMCRLPFWARTVSIHKSDRFVGKRRKRFERNVFIAMVENKFRVDWRSSFKRGYDELHAKNTRNTVHEIRSLFDSRRSIAQIEWKPKVVCALDVTAVVGEYGEWRMTFRMERHSCILIIGKDKGRYFHTAIVKRRENRNCEIHQKRKI